MRLNQELAVEKQMNAVVKYTRLELKRREKQEFARLQEGAKAQVTSKEKEMTEALRMEEKNGKRRKDKHTSTTLQLYKKLSS